MTKEQFENAFEQLEAMARQVEGLDQFNVLYSILLISVKQSLFESQTLSDICLWRQSAERLKGIVVKQLGYVRSLRDEAKIKEFENIDHDTDRWGNA